LTEIAAGVMGMAATWVASTGARVAVSSWCCVWESGADTAPGRGLWEAGPWFLGGQAALLGL
jgi:hypothetical protein